MSDERFKMLWHVDDEDPCELHPPLGLSVQIKKAIELAKSLEEDECARDLEEVERRLWNRYPFSEADQIVCDAYREWASSAEKGDRPWPKSQIEFAAYLQERGTPLGKSAISKALKKQGITLKGKPPGRPPKK